MMEHIDEIKKRFEKRTISGIMFKEPPDPDWKTEPMGLTDIIIVVAFELKRKADL